MFGNDNRLFHLENKRVRTNNQSMTIRLTSPLHRRTRFYYMTYNTIYLKVKLDRRGDKSGGRSKYIRRAVGIELEGGLNSIRGRSRYSHFKPYINQKCSPYGTIMELRCFLNMFVAFSNLSADKSATPSRGYGSPNCSYLKLPRV